MKRTPSIEYSEAAYQDLVQLWSAYAEVSEELADRILARLELRIDELSRHPQMGRLRPEFNFDGLRSTAVRPHVIFYVISDAPAIQIHRVVDGRRNLAALFGHE